MPINRQDAKTARKKTKGKTKRRIAGESEMPKFDPLLAVSASWRLAFIRIELFYKSDPLLRLLLQNEKRCLEALQLNKQI